MQFNALVDNITLHPSCGNWHLSFFAWLSSARVMTFIWLMRQIVRGERKSPTVGGWGVESALCISFSFFFKLRWKYQHNFDQHHHHQNIDLWIISVWQSSSAMYWGPSRLSGQDVFDKLTLLLSSFVQIRPLIDRPPPLSQYFQLCALERVAKKELLGTQWSVQN